LLDVLDSIITRCSKEEINFFAIVAKKNIWVKRNQVVHGGDFIPPNIIVQEAVTLLHAFHIVLEGDDFLQDVIEHEPITIAKWEKPHFGCYKVNWDVSVDSS
jgi:hypothetical protein